jgi:hypothetical protein
LAFRACGDRETQPALRSLWGLKSDAVSSQLVRSPRVGAGEPKLIDHETATAVHHEIGHPLAGWFQLQAMHAEILAEQPDLLD